MHYSIGEVQKKTSLSSTDSRQAGTKFVPIICSGLGIVATALILWFIGGMII